MKKIILLVVFLYAGFFGFTNGQAFIKTAELMKRDGSKGQLNISQDPATDTLVSRYILMSKRVYQENSYFGMTGYRIQIYFSSNRNARDESIEVRASFMSKFPEIPSYHLYSEPGYFKVRAGDFRTRSEAVKLLLAISREFPDSYIVPDIIEFPELKRK